MPLLVSDQECYEWLQARKYRITASVAAACLNLGGKGSSAKLAWRNIQDVEPERDNAYMEWGRENEPKARLAYEIHTGLLVEKTGFWIHPTASWLGASPDGLIGQDGLVEIKCPQKLPTKIPTKHLIQCLVQLVVTQREWCDYFAWIPGSDFTAPQFFLQRVHRKGLVGLVNRLWKFYSKYVLANVEPPRKKPVRREKKCVVEDQAIPV